MPPTPTAMIAARRAVPPTPLWDRFWPKVDMSRGLTGCWIWIGAYSRKSTRRYRNGRYRPNGYDRPVIQEAGRGSRLLIAARVALCFAGDGLAEYSRPEEAAHICGNPRCVNNYSHLYWGSPADNDWDRIQQEERDWCPLYFTRGDAEIARLLEQIGGPTWG